MDKYHQLILPVRPICMLDDVNAAVGRALLVLAALNVLAQPHRGAVATKPLRAAYSRTSAWTLLNSVP